MKQTCGSRWRAEEFVCQESSGRTWNWRPSTATASLALALAKSRVQGLPHGDHHLTLILLGQIDIGYHTKQAEYGGGVTAGDALVVDFAP